MVYRPARLPVADRSSVMLRWLVAACLVLSGLIVFSTPAFADTTVKAEEKNPDNPDTTISIVPPEGFEDMAQPEQTRIDVFFGGVKLGSYAATYDLATVTFENPQKIAKKIPHLRKGTREKILERLKKPLDKNLAAHCPKEVIDQKAICGSIVPEVAGIIFYEDTFKADIFVNPEFLDLQDTRLGIVLPKAEDIFSGVHTFNGTVTGTDVDNSNFSLMQGSILSYGRGRVNFSNVITPDQSYVNTAAIGVDRGGMLSRVGFFDTGHFQTIPQVRLGGVSVETSFDTNLDLKRTAGNQLTIYLPKRSWVTLLRGKTIYSSDFYEAGNQIIDTSQLPDGAYELTLQINEGSGTTREERRFFAKNFNIPPTNVPVYYMQAGMLRNDAELTTLPQLSDQHVFIAGTTRRLTKSTGVNIGVMNTDDNNFLETSLFGIFPKNHQIALGGLGSTQGDYGASATYIGSAFKDRLGFSASARKIWAAPDKDAGLTLTPSLSALNNDPIAFEPQDAWQASSTLSYQLTDDFSFNFQYNETSTGTAAKNRSYGPYIRWNLWQQDEKTVMLFADATQSTSANNASAYLRFSYNFGKWGLNTEGGSRWQKDKSASATSNSNSGDLNPYGNTRLSWSDTDTPGRVINAGVEMNKDRSTESKRADLDYRSRAGRMKLDLAQNTTSTSDTIMGTGSFGFNVLHGGAHIAAGGDREERSGFIVNSNDTEKENRKRGKKDPISAKVFVNGSDVGIVNPGDNLPVLLSPYETYKVTAQPVNSDKPVEVTTATRDITLYPGNVIPISLDIHRIYIMIGRLVDDHGFPVANARLKNARGLVVTDEDGNFQAEMTDPQTLVFSYIKNHFSRNELYGPFEPYGPPAPGAARQFDPIPDPASVPVVAETETLATPVEETKDNTVTQTVAAIEKPTDAPVDTVTATEVAPAAAVPVIPVTEEPASTTTAVAATPPATIEQPTAPAPVVAPAGFTLQDIKDNVQNGGTPQPTPVPVAVAPPAENPAVTPVTPAPEKTEAPVVTAQAAATQVAKPEPAPAPASTPISVDKPLNLPLQLPQQPVVEKSPDHPVTDNESDQTAADKDKKIKLGDEEDLSHGKADKKDKEDEEDDDEEETDTHREGDPTMVVPENTPQWVRDAAKLQNQRNAFNPSLKITCSATVPSYQDKNGVIILKEALTCTPQKDPVKSDDTIDPADKKKKD